MLASWGIVMWVLVAFVEAIMHLGLPTTFGFDPLRVAAHAAGLAVLILLRTIDVLAERRRRQARRSQSRRVSHGE